MPYEVRYKNNVIYPPQHFETYGEARQMLNEIDCELFFNRGEPYWGFSSQDYILRIRSVDGTLVPIETDPHDTLNHRRFFREIHVNRLVGEGQGEVDNPERFYADEYISNSTPDVLTSHDSTRFVRPNTQAPTGEDRTN
jgi:hypothetical protein